MALQDDFRAAVAARLDEDQDLVATDDGFHLRSPGGRGDLVQRVSIDPEGRRFTMLDTSSGRSSTRGGLRRGLSFGFFAGRVAGARGHRPIREAAAELGLTEKRPRTVTGAIVVAAIGASSIVVVPLAFLIKALAQ